MRFCRGGGSKNLKFKLTKYTNYRDGLMIVCVSPYTNYRDGFDPPYMPGGEGPFDNIEYTIAGSSIL